MQMERSERKWVLCCIPQSRWWVFLNKFLNTVSDFTTCPKFVLHPTLHSLTQSTRMIFSQTVWLPFASVCLSHYISYFYLHLIALFTLYSLSFSFFLFFAFIRPNSAITLSPPFTRLLATLISEASALVFENEKKEILRSEGVCVGRNVNPIRLCCY